MVIYIYIDICIYTHTYVHTHTLSIFKRLTVNLPMQGGGGALALQSPYFSKSCLSEVIFPCSCEVLVQL